MSSKNRKKRRISSSLQVSKRKKENQNTRRSPTISYPRDRQVQKNSVINAMHDERFPENYTKPVLPKRGGRKEEEEEGWEQNSLDKHYPDPLEMAQVIQQDRSKKNKEWHQQSLPQQSRGHVESWQHTTTTIGDPFPLHEHLREAHNIVEDDKVEDPGHQKTKPHLTEPQSGQPHGMVQDLWLQLSGKKCVTVSSGNPEAAVSEARGNPDTWNPSDSMMKEENQRNTFSGQPSWQKAHASVGKSQQGQAQQDILKLDTMQPATKVTTKPSSTQPRGLDTHYNQDTSQSISQIFKNFAQNTHTAHRDEKNTSEGISHIFKGFAGNTGDKPGTSGSTRHSPEDEVLSTKASSECTKIDVVNVLEVLTHLGDKLGALCDPLKLVLERTKELQTNGADPMAITNDQDSKLLLQMIQEKLQGILKDGNLNIIKKVIIQEAEQRLSVLLDLQEQRSLTGNLNLVQLARHCLNMDTTATVDFIRKILQCQGHTHLSERQLMKLYMAVKSEQLKVVGDHHDDRAATLTDNNCQSHNKPEAPLGLQVIRDSAGSLRGSSSALSLPHAKSHAPASHFDSLPWRGRQPCSDTAQRTQNTLDPDLQWETFNYPQEAVTGNIKPSKTSPSQSSTFQSWSPQCHTTVPHLKASTSTLHDSSQDAFRESRYHQKTPRFMYKKPICITLPKHEPQKSIVGSFNPLEDYETDNEEY